MGKMKMVFLLAQESNSVRRIKKVISKAESEKLRYCIFEGEFLTIEQAKAMVKLITIERKKQYNLNDTLHLEPDEHTIEQD